MARKDEIKVYNEKEDIVADYDNFRKDWDYDRDGESGTHKSGLKISKVFMNGVKFQFPNLPQWMTEMKEGGMTREEANLYLSMLKNQFVVINEKEPRIEKEQTLEGNLALLEAIHKSNIEDAIKYNHIDAAKVKELEKNFEEFKEQYRKNWGTGRWD